MCVWCDSVFVELTLLLWSNLTFFHKENQLCWRHSLLGPPLPLICKAAFLLHLWLMVFFDLSHLSVLVLLSRYHIYHSHQILGLFVILIGISLNLLLFGKNSHLSILGISEPWPWHVSLFRSFSAFSNILSFSADILHSC